jgi:hypothetical protein
MQRKTTHTQCKCQIEFNHRDGEATGYRGFTGMLTAVKDHSELLPQSGSV